MRGINFPEVDDLWVDWLLMDKFHQQYSEIQHIPMRTVMFLIRMAESEAQYTEAEAKKMKASTGKFKRGRR